MHLSGKEIRFFVCLGLLLIFSLHHDSDSSFNIEEQNQIKKNFVSKVTVEIKVDSKKEIENTTIIIIIQ